METKTIRRAVFDDDYIQELAANLDQLPGRIKVAKEAIVEHETLLKYNTGVADAKQAVADLEVEVAYEVKNDLDDKGQKKFSNEEKRKVETRRRLLGDPNYSTMYVEGLNIIKDALSAEAAMKMDLGKACAQFAAIDAEYKCKLAIANMIAGLAHESTTEERTYRHVTTVRLGDNNHV